MQKIFGLVAAMAMIVVMLITSFEIAIYSDYGWYQKEYEKYQVLDDLEMEMQDVMDVTEEMMAYLRGDRKNLEVKTVIAGEEGMFFNEREKLHMEDVQGPQSRLCDFRSSSFADSFSERKFKRDFTSDVWMGSRSVPWGGSSVWRVGRD